MNNLYRDLAPITEAAWEEIELEATRTFKRHIAGRRVVDVSEPGGPITAAVSTGRLLDVKPHPPTAWLPNCGRANPLSGLGFRLPCRATRSTTSSAVRRTPTGTRSKPRPRSWRSSRIVPSSRATPPRRSTAFVAAAPTRRWRCPRIPATCPTSISQALTALRLAGVDGPYSVLLSADVYTGVSETTEHGYPIREHLNRLVDGDIIWAPAIDGAMVLTTRGGDFDLQLGTDVAIGYRPTTPTPCSCICRRP